jgi:light-dependent protochlorophyllide reductase
MANKNVIWCDEETLSKDLTNKTYIVTGANSGVGFETTKQLVKQGAHVVMACRRPEAGEEAQRKLNGLKGRSEVLRCDLSDLQSVRDFVAQFRSNHKSLDGLVCNAGMVNMENKPKYTKHGFEYTWSASYFGHFLLTELLLDMLKTTPGSRMAIVSSVVHAGSPKKRPKVHLEDLHHKNRKYNNFEAYGEAKVAVILYAKELAERLNGTGVTTYSIHPGWARSNFGSGGGFLTSMLFSILKPVFTLLNFSDSSWESAQTSLHCILSDDAPKHSGAYFSQHSILYRDKECRKGGWPMETPNPNARDMDTAKKLVEMTRPLVGLN